ncbi:hypothetical protein D1AOALGA4SA_3242 [Olavius algarvensis Delta 1 endosymbiont]|nr:hypothetical protein D1AOALGA4SA_3242 [Olavius algarvensis Delta 1 endosymbiont]
MLPDHRRQRFDTERWESHYFDALIIGPGTAQLPGKHLIVVFVSNIYQKYIHEHGPSKPNIARKGSSLK